MISGSAAGFADAAQRVAEGATRSVHLPGLGDGGRLPRAGAAVGRVGGVGLDLQHLEEPLVVAVGLVERVQRFGRVAPRVGQVEQRSRCRLGSRGATDSSMSACRNASSAPDQSFWWTRRTSPRRASTSTASRGLSDRPEIDLERVGEIGAALGPS